MDPKTTLQDLLNAAIREKDEKKRDLLFSAYYYAVSLEPKAQHDFLAQTPERRIELATVCQSRSKSHLAPARAKGPACSRPGVIRWGVGAAA